MHKFIVPDTQNHEKTNVFSISHETKILNTIAQLLLSRQYFENFTKKYFVLLIRTSVKPR